MSTFSEEQRVSFLLGIRTECQSSNVRAAWYVSDQEGGALYIEFKGPDGGPGTVYWWFGIPFSVAESFAAADSKGHWCWVHFNWPRVTYDGKFALA